MRAFIARRLLQAATVIVVVTTLTFFLVHLAPGDPLAGNLDDPRVSETVRQHWRHVYGLDQSLPAQYVHFVGEIARGQFGYSIALNEPVTTALRDALPNTALLVGSALILSFGIGVLIALAQVVRRGSMTDRALGRLSLALYCTPDFWLAQVALLTFAYLVPIFPAGGTVDPVMHAYLGPWAALTDRLHHLILPALTLAALSAARVARFQRAALLDVASDDYLRTARAKGLSEQAVIVRHALRNALIPTITLFGLSLPGFLTGAVFVEKVFAWPGIGSLAIDAVAARDYAVVIACAFVASVLVVVGSLIADLLYLVADPRLRHTGAIATAGTA